MKKCSRCLTDLPLDAFHKTGHIKRDGIASRRSVCRVCKNEEYAAKSADPDRREQLKEHWRKASNKYTKEQHRSHKRKLVKYGITDEEFAELRDRENGCCHICGGTSLLMAIDHCHATSTVRGYLCGPCNTGLGMFKDSPSTLRAAANYVEKFHSAVEQPGCAR